MANVVRFPQVLREKDTFGIFSDFYNFATGTDGWTSLVVDGGTSVAVNDAVGGRVTLTTGATDNNEASLRSTTEIFLVAAGKPLFCEGRIQYTEANTDDANVFFGFMSALAANSLIDDGGGPRASGSIAGIYKLDGGTVWRCVTRDNDGEEVTASVTTAGGASFQTLRVEIVDSRSAYATVAFYVDDTTLKDSNGKDITHTFTVASATEMNFGLYVKAGSANSETPIADYLGAWQLR